jgi:hypothetical protein
MTKSERFQSIRFGDRVTILIHAGISMHGPKVKPAIGRAVMFNPKYNCWVLNMGGRYGTPGIASVNNLVSVRHSSQH